MVIEGDSRPDRVIEKTNSRLPAGKRSPCRDVAVVRSLLVLPCSREQNALHTLNPPASPYAIMRRACPYRGENHGPGKDARELDNDARN